MDQVFKVDKGLHVKGANSIFEQRVTINDVLYVNADAVFITGNLTVTGNLTYSNTTLAGDMYPAVSGLNLGNTTNRFALFATDINVSGQVIPNATNGNLGTTSLRWFVYSSNTDVQNVLTANNLIVNGNLIFANSTTRKVGVNAVPSGSGVLQVGGDMTVTGNVAATAFSAPTLAASGNVVSLNGGQFVSNSATIASTGVAQVIDAFPATAAKYAKYNIRVANTTTGIHGAEVVLVHEGTNVIMTVEEVFASELGSFDASIVTGSVQLTYTGTSGETVKLLRMQVLE
jgi:hypothetical protein